MNKFSLQARQRCATFLPGASNTTKLAGNLPDSEVFSRPDITVFGRDAQNGNACGTTNFVFETSRPPAAHSNAASGLQSQLGAETMTTVNTPTTPKTGNPGTKPTLPAFTQIGRILRERVVHRPPPKLDPIERQQAIENALSAALWHVRKDSNHATLQAATGRAIRAVSMLKQACEATNGGRA